MSGRKLRRWVLFSTLLFCGALLASIFVAWDASWLADIPEWTFGERAFALLVVAACGGLGWLFTLE